MIKKLLTEAVSAAIKNEKVTWAQEICDAQWDDLFRLANAHKVLPLVFDAVADCPAAKAADENRMAAVKRNVFRQVMIQVTKTEEFLELYQHLDRSGFRPVLVKGLTCRELYPNPDYRASSDEDLLIVPEAFFGCHEAMLAFGMQVSDPKADLQTDYEVPYRKAESPLYIELHRHLFSPGNEAYGDLNRFFEGDCIRTVQVSVSGVELTTLHPTDHLFYLICHAYKHFIHSGFGLRQLCDIGLFAKAHADEIDWQQVYTRCAAIRGEYFVAALLKIAKVHLDISLDTASFPDLWRSLDIEESALLEDMILGGVYGKTTASRVHSSNMTLDAVANSQSGSGRKSSLKGTLFPARSKLEKRYPYLKKFPALLPVAWASRMVSYGVESLRNEGNALEAVQTGKERIALLKQYRVIDP